MWGSGGTAADQLHTLTSAVPGLLTVSFMTRQLYTRGKRPRCPLNTTLGETSADLDALKRTALVTIGNPTRGRIFFPVLYGDHTGSGTRNPLPHLTTLISLK